MLNNNTIIKIVYAEKYTARKKKYYMQRKILYVHETTTLYTDDDTLHNSRVINSFQ